MINENDLTIYCSYHNSKLIKDYNLDYLPNYIELFNTNDLTLKEDNINYLNPYFAEIVTYYYIWKNQIYSKYIGFCHYRRFYWHINFENLIKYNSFYHTTITREHIYNDEYISSKNVKDLFDYLNTKHIFNYDTLYKYFYTNTWSSFIPWHISYILSWDKFNQLCELFFDFLNYIFPNYKDITLYDSMYNNINTQKRMLSYYGEVWMGIILSLLNDNKDLSVCNESEEPYMKYTLLTKSNNADDILLWIKKNNRASSLMYILCNKENISVINKALYNKKYWATEYIKLINNIEEIENKDNIIKLNINEYIKCLDPINFRKDIYTIETIK